MAYPAIVFGPRGRLDKVTRRIESQVRPLRTYLESDVRIRTKRMYHLNRKVRSGVKKGKGKEKERTCVCRSTDRPSSPVFKC
ncbi:hypothetical protein VN97_g7607 [Penicillium thymicola]|uniref:Uncharacterized protein n=1 Tax=Penicillium thymicola TaxID=293382 RepID=A0AAI9X6X4_PENTH|nr:hypothetical protein VN97_g7607 [Penicillium thymicola]